MRDLAKLLNAINWKTAGWKQVFLIEGKTSWGGQASIKITFNHYEKVWELADYGRRLGRLPKSFQSLDHIAAHISKFPQVVLELEENNVLNERYINNQIATNRANVSKKASATRQVKSEGIAVGMLPLLKEEDGEHVAVKDYPGTTAVVLSHKFNTKQISFCCSAFCEYHDVPLTITKSQEGWDVKNFPPAVIAAAIEWLKVDHESDL